MSNQNFPRNKTYVSQTDSLVRPKAEVPKKVEPEHEYSPYSKSIGKQIVVYLRGRVEPLTCTLLETWKFELIVSDGKNRRVIMKHAVDSIILG